MVAAREGEGLNKLLFTTRIPISPGFTPVFPKTSSIAPNITASVSFLASFIVLIIGICIKAVEPYVLSPKPDLSNIFFRNPKLSGVKNSLSLHNCRKSSLQCSLPTIVSFPGLKHAKFSK
ncbi:hypothetical protein GQ457_14G018410 [Hibiscus cannabinus]